VEDQPVKLYAPHLSKQEVSELRRLGVKLEEPTPEIDPEAVQRAVMAELARKLPFLFARNATLPRARLTRLKTASLEPRF
jgi:hypothetical protein